MISIQRQISIFQTCLQYSRGHKRASLEAGCCNSDRCNNKPPSILKIEADKNYTGLGNNYAINANIVLLQIVQHWFSIMTLTFE